MNTLFGILFVITFLFLSTNDYWGWGAIGVVAILFVLPFTTPEKIGEKKNKK